jgi:hypothetical protein
VKESICSLFHDFAQNETQSNCSKVQDLVINVLKCLVDNNCICSQSTEKLNCSSQDENISVGTNMESGDTLKLPSNDTSRNPEENQGWFLYIHFSLFSFYFLNLSISVEFLNFFFMSNPFIFSLLFHHRKFY